MVPIADGVLIDKIDNRWLLLSCQCRVKVMDIVFNATFNNISDISMRSVYCWRKPEYPEKTTDMRNFVKQCCIEYTSPWTRFELKASVVIGTDYTCSWISIRSRPRRSLFWPVDCNIIYNITNKNIIMTLPIYLFIDVSHSFRIRSFLCYHTPSSYFTNS